METKQPRLCRGRGWVVDDVVGLGKLSRHLNYDTSVIGVSGGRGGCA